MTSFMLNYSHIAGRVVMTAGLLSATAGSVALAQQGGLPPQAWPGTLYPPQPGQTPPPVESWRIQTAPAQGNSHIKPINRPPSSIPRSVFYGNQQTAPKYPTGVYGQPNVVPGVPGAEVLRPPQPLPGVAPEALPLPKDGPMSPDGDKSKAAMVDKGAAADDMKGKAVPPFANGQNFAPGSWAAQIGAFARRDLAEKFWTRLKGEIAFMQNLQPVYQDASVAGRDVTRLRVLVGDGSKDTTNGLCRAMKSVGQACWIDRL